MTVVTKRVSAAHRQRRLGDAPVAAAVNPQTMQLLHYEEGGTSPERYIPLDAALFSEQAAVQVRADLLDCHVDICAPEVLMLMTDNFDYQHLRRDFVSGTLKEAELGNKIYFHELLDSEYAARVHNLRSYDAVARDVVRRWAYPLVPDNNQLPLAEETTYTYERRNVYKEAGVAVARSAVVGPDAVLAAGTQVGDQSVISRTVVGKSCRIGEGCVLDGCHLHAGVVVGDGARLVNSLVCEGAVIHAGAVLEPGCVVASNCVIGAGHQLPMYSRVSLHRQPASEDVDSSDDELEYSNAGGAGGGDNGAEAGELSVAQLAAVEAAKAGQPPPPVGWEWDASDVGVGGAGYRWEPRPGDEEWRFSLAPATGGGLAEQWEDDPWEEELSLLRKASSVDKEVAGGAAAGGGGEEDDEDDEDEDAAREAWFRREVTETFLRCIKNGYEESNIVVELQGLKLAENRTFADLARYVLTALLGLSLPAPPETAKEYRALYPAEAPEGSGKLLGSAKPRLAKWAPMLRRFLKNDDDQVEVLLTLEDFCAEEDVFAASGGGRYTPIFAQVLHALYDNDVLSEDAVLAWAEEKGGAEEGDKKFLNLAKPFITWLQEADEDDSEEESDEDEE